MENEQESMMELFATYSVKRHDGEIIKGEKYYVFPDEYKIYDMVDVFTRDGSTKTFIGQYHKLNFVTLAVWRDIQINSILDGE